ncbi:HlyD family type I secretion periplasmic adaptor subunit [Chromobacterium amazonense]|uniref:Membrane fusion protein (MFP) family protein n=1 Tax=Chromobacterium amazonense TaxID=1382803 RepID=A0ABU8V0H9_9NEIS|nr:HlyD family type I secretion periplasmic adaptor subunit [Chromobacterium amazonense]MDQ4539879.1 HlyD family type I secretion periplasmic adaptor subunit [Chromobacterium amazonense]
MKHPFWQRWVEQGQRKTSPYWERVMDWAEARDLQEHVDFATDADWAILQQSPGRPRVFIWTMAGLILVAFMWAAFAQINEVTKGQGKVVPTSQIQHIQSLDGGVVAKLWVREGQIVQQNQLLLSIDNTRFVSSLQANQAQYLALLGKAARLGAIAHGTPLAIPAQVSQQAPDIARQETALYMAKKQELDNNLAIARGELAQRAQEMNEMKARRQQADQSFQFTSKELEQTRPLLDSGAASDVDLLRLEREVSRFKGDRDMAQAQIFRLQAAIEQANRKIQENELSFRNQASAELSDTMAKINSLSADTSGLANKVKLSDVRSPVHGQVKQIYANTIGGVVGPGKDIMEIVPLGESLVVETRILPRDIAFIRPGQRATVRFTAYDYTIYGGMEGVVQDVSADTETDERGNSFYLAKIKTKQGTLGERHLPIIPGMVAQVDIMTGTKSILSYLLKPVLRAKSEAFTER